MAKICSVQGCDSPNYGQGVCSKHYQQIRRCGEVKERTTFDSNEFLIEGNICKIGCYNKNGKLVGYGLIDIWNIDKCKPYKWYINNSGYVVSGSPPILLHTYLSGFIHPDHIDRNPLNNTESNLRESTLSQQQWNTGKSKNNTSGYKGVYWGKQKGKWQAYLMKEGKRFHIGFFDNLEKAAIARDNAARDLHGEFAVLNIAKPTLLRRNVING